MFYSVEYLKRRASLIVIFFYIFKYKEIYEVFDKLGTNICVSMHVTTNSNNDILIQFFECRPKIMETIA